MRALVTGSRGTVGSVLVEVLQNRGYEVVRWDRSQVSTTNYPQMESFVRRTAPDVLFHLAAASQPGNAPESSDVGWEVNYEWTSELAWIAKEVGCRFVFTSTVMVFTDEQPGPYSIASTPNAEEGYGMHKRRAEERAFKQNSESRVVRLGWQIADGLRGNHMAAWLSDRKSVALSTRWIPACSYVGDTAHALADIANLRPGLYHLNANQGWSMYDLAMALREKHDADWDIRPTFDWCYDQRLIDLRVSMREVSEFLTALRRPR